MPSLWLGRTLLAVADSLSVREELVGDLFEELALGRSAPWMCVQLAGLFAVAAANRVRERARMTPLVVALAICATLFAAIPLASPGLVLEAWLCLYYIAGTASLFAHFASRAADARVDMASAPGSAGGGVTSARRKDS